ncbi:MAG: AsnC family transcriptional regulator [Candidatus Bathyarchaeota archaeon]|nr:AsnC family transcriptional regulator [Candidatus Bathyarchaeota archaeon]
MDKLDREILIAVQNGIPLKREPFKETAEKIGITEKELLRRLNRMNDEGDIRRFSANINQRKLGIIANAVVVWNIPEEKIDDAIKVFMGSPEISHLYERVTYPGRWEYNLYSVVHDYSVESVRRFAHELADKIGVNDYQVLFSKKRFKGTSSRLAPRR